jgi:hypothetical protein
MEGFSNCASDGIEPNTPKLSNTNKRIKASSPYKKILQ